MKIKLITIILLGGLFSFYRTSISTLPHRFISGNLQVVISSAFRRGGEYIRNQCNRHLETYNPHNKDFSNITENLITRFEKAEKCQYRKIKKDLESLFIINRRKAYPAQTKNFPKINNQGNNNNKNVNFW